MKIYQYRFAANVDIAATDDLDAGRQLAKLIDRIEEGPGVGVGDVSWRLVEKHDLDADR